jgi:glycerol uptake facilitator-like aquaporin
VHTRLRDSGGSVLLIRRTLAERIGTALLLIAVVGAVRVLYLTFHDLHHVVVMPHTEVS